MSVLHRPSNSQHACLQLRMPCSPPTESTHLGSRGSLLGRSSHWRHFCPPQLTASLDRSARPYVHRCHHHHKSIHEHRDSMPQSYASSRGYNRAIFAEHTSSTWFPQFVHEGLDRPKLPGDTGGVDFSIAGALRGRHNGKHPSSKIMTTRKIRKLARAGPEAVGRKCEVDHLEKGRRHSLPALELEHRVEYVPLVLDLVPSEQKAPEAR